MPQSDEKTFAEVWSTAQHNRGVYCHLLLRRAYASALQLNVAPQLRQVGRVLVVAACRLLGADRKTSARDEPFRVNLSGHTGRRLQSDTIHRASS